jgi:heterotetrameric sarcosine oxidase gamma subunit
MNTATRQSPIAHNEASNEVAATLVQLTDLVSIGLKGPGLSDFAARIGLQIPSNLYEVSSTGENGLLSRVGGEEITIDCPEGDPLMVKIEESFTESIAGLYRIEQQQAIFELRGNKAVRVLAQTCGVDPTVQPTNRIFFTRIAGVSCGIIVLERQAGRVYRIRVDYTLAPYLWDTLAEIARES